MNANELADVFSCVMPSEKYYDEMQDAAFMLRQQQAEVKGRDAVIDILMAEIEALKAKDLKKSMAIRSLNTQLKKALQYETYSR